MQKLKFSKYLELAGATALTKFMLGTGVITPKSVATDTGYDVSTVRKWYKANPWELTRSDFSDLTVEPGENEFTRLIISGSLEVNILPDDNELGTLIVDSVDLFHNEIGEYSISTKVEGAKDLYVGTDEELAVKALCINGKWLSGNVLINADTLEYINSSDEDENLDLSNADEAIWNASKKFINISLGEQCWTATPDSHSNFKTILDLLIDGENAEAIKLISVKAAIKEFTKGHIKIVGNQLTYKDINIQSGLSDRIISMYQDNQDISKLVAFLEKVMENPTRKTVYRLFDFLKANDIEITEDGHFEAWKVIRSDFTDCYTGTIDNSPGKIVEMDRFLVQDDDNITCSHGLHVCARSYISYFSGSSDILVKVKVHPKDVVSIPTDYNDAKMRVCKYEVIGLAK